MNKLKLLITFSLLLFASIAFSQDIPDAPNPPRLVNDYTNTLSSEQKAQLEHKLVAFNDSTSNQIAVVIIPSLNGYEIADYAVKLGQKWGVGQKEKRNGVVLLVSLGDRKVFIAVGYGLEGAIPDAYAKRITSTIIKPEFKAGNYFKGIDDGTDAIMKFASGEYKVDANDVVPGKKGKGSGIWIFFVVLGGILIFSLLRRRSYQHIANRGSGSSLPFWMLMNMMGNSGGRNSGGGDWGDFSGGGGDFGGFGGGDFGGGGAGDSW
ncbi:TPM domain-containing protein [Solitalea sp. MAHUQ-68]|uniref:TPM domain-containing protein n=1 Tax=Solitalea agri TaxID=2953739 RepID=A0A9X2JCN4_9SPHI|nr:TPM domain-containing protein [Solitalea agri]MCO4293258.1 TPM domain-containing protein [Solitalea agri]